MLWLVGLNFQLVGHAARKGGVRLGELGDDRVRSSTSISLLVEYLAEVADLCAQLVDQLVGFRPVVAMATVRYATS